MTVDFMHSPRWGEVICTSCLPGFSHWSQLCWCYLAHGGGAVEAPPSPVPAHPLLARSYQRWGSSRAYANLPCPINQASGALRGQMTSPSFSAQVHQGNPSLTPNKHCSLRVKMSDKQRCRHARQAFASTLRPSAAHTTL